MSYGFHRLKPTASAEDYVASVATQQKIIIAIGSTVVTHQGNEVISHTPDIPENDQSIPKMTTNEPTEVGNVRSQGYTGDICAHCQGSRMRWAGHCQVCEDCGESSGCS